MTHRVTLCRSCPLGRTGFAEELAQVFKDLPLELHQTECMSGCTRPSTLAFRAPGKTAYLFGDLSAADLPDLVTFARAYLASPDGTFPDARPFGELRTKALARIPA
jgi:predicted metal-binding protein